MIRTVSKKSEVYKVFCKKTGEETLLINCHDCDHYGGYNPKGRKLDCKDDNK